MFPFGAVTVSVMSPLLSVVPLTSIVVEPSMPPAVSDNTPTEAVSTAHASSSDAAIILLTDADDDELPPETSMSTDRLYFEELPWFTAIV